MLRHFHVFQCRHDNGRPMCRALWCVGSEPSRPLAHAWIHTLDDGGDFKIVPVPSGKSRSTEALIKSLHKLLKTTEPDIEALLHELEDHLLAKAEETLLKRERGLKTTGRRYRSSHYAGIDAAMTCAPLPTHMDYPGRLAAARGGFEYSANNVSLAFSMTQDKPVKVPRKKTVAQIWEDHTECPHIMAIISGHKVLAPHTNLDILPRNSKTIQLMLRDEKYDTAPQRLALWRKVLRGAEQWLCGGKYVARCQEWLDNNPPPLFNGRSNNDIARLPREEYMELVKQQLIWLNHAAALRLRRMNITDTDKYLMPLYRPDGDRWQSVGGENLYSWAVKQCGKPVTSNIPPQARTNSPFLDTLR